MRLQATAFDIQELHRTFGVEVDAVDVLELQKEMSSLDERSLAEQTQMLTAAWKYHDEKKPSAETLKKVIGAYVVLDRWASERGWIGLDTKCVTGLAPQMGFTPCMTGSLLSRKYFYQCENDIPGLLTQVILGLLSGTMTGYWELYEILTEGLLLGCCGFCPESLLDEAVKIRVFGDYFPGMMGCCTRYKLGPCTLGRIGKNAEGEYLFHCVEGEAAEPPRWYEDAVGMPQHPSVTFVPEVPIARLLEQILAQHFAIAYGHWQESVVEFTKLAGIAVS